MTSGADADLPAPLCRRKLSAFDSVEENPVDELGVGVPAPDPGGPDSDGDGVPEVCDPCPLDNPDDTDGDTTPDYLDDDDDGLPDSDEALAGSYSLI